MDWKDLIQVAERSMVMLGVIFLIMALALGLNYYFVLEQIPDQIVAYVQQFDLTRTQFLIGLNIFLLMVGAVMDIMSAILILAPMLAPMALAMHVDPLHLGVIFIVNLEIGYLTPPVGLNLFVASSLFREKIQDVIKAVLPFLAILVLGLGLVTWCEPLSLGLVRLTKGQPFFGLPAGSTKTAVEEEKMPSIEDMMKAIGVDAG